jgi:inner membrane protein
MSSFVGHALIGVSILSNSRYTTISRMVVYSIIGGILATVPDFDYLIYWLSGYRSDIRYTHTLFYCLCVSGFTYMLIVYSTKSMVKDIHPLLFIVTPISHLVLDLFVSVHSLWLFWPFSNYPVEIPFGFMPSAGYLSITNYYLWRNLFIEMGILFPIALLVIPVSRKTIKNGGIGIKLGMAMVFIIFLIWGLGLQR